MTYAWPPARVVIGAVNEASDKRGGARKSVHTKETMYQWTYWGKWGRYPTQGA
jgi:hypothetical protein